MISPDQGVMDSTDTDHTTTFVPNQTMFDKLGDLSNDPKSMFKFVQRLITTNKPSMEVIGNADSHDADSFVDLVDIK